MSSDVCIRCGLPHPLNEMMLCEQCGQDREIAMNTLSRRTILSGLTGLGIAGGSILWFKKPGTVVPPSLASSGQHTRHVTGEILYSLSDAFIIAWSPDSMRLAVAGDAVRLLDATTGITLFTYNGHTDEVLTVSWSPDGKHIASGGFDQTVRVWEAATGRDIFVYDGHSHLVRDVVWSPDSKYIASASYDKTVHIWNATTASNVTICRGHTHEVCAVQWSPDGSYLVSSDLGNVTHVW